MTRKDGRVTTAPGQEDGDFMVTAEFGLHMGGGGMGGGRGGVAGGEGGGPRDGLLPRSLQPRLP